MNSRKVVVKTALSIESRQDGRMFAAHLSLGLTGYGRTPGEAKESAKALFNKWVNAYRELGVLVERLDELGADWRWYDEYTDATPVEDTAPDAQQAASTQGTPALSDRTTMAVAA